MKKAKIPVYSRLQQRNTVVKSILTSGIVRDLEQLKLSMPPEADITLEKQIKM